VGHVSLGDTASGMLPPTALGRYTEPNDSLAQAQDWFWTSTSKRGRDVYSGSDISLDTYAGLDSRSALDRYFAEVEPRRDSAAIQVGPSPWTLMTPSSTQGGPSPSSDPKTPPPRTVVATTRTEMYMRHTSQDVMVTFHQVFIVLHPHPRQPIHAILRHRRLHPDPVFDSGSMLLTIRLLLLLQL